MAVADAAPMRRQRIAGIDIARGTALIGMFIYHLCWDLAYFSFIDEDLPSTPPLRVFANTVAVLFLLLVGVSLVLACRRRIEWPAYFERLVWITAAAAAVSLGTWFLFPQSFIYFGILHCILVATILALPFVRLPLWTCAAAAAIAFGLPLFASPAFDRPSLWWLGLGTSPPPTFDYRPVFPWAGVVLAGVAAARLVLPRAAGARWIGWTPRSHLGRLVGWGGRHSLLCYLVHQPIFIALLFLLSHTLGTSSHLERQPFVRSCQRQCGAAGAKPTICEAACRCVVERAKQEGLWDKVLANGLSAQEGERFRHFGGECLRASPAPASPSR